MKEQTIGKQIGKKLKQMRINKMKTQKGKAKLTQARLAEKLGICRETVVAIETGHSTTVDCMRKSTMAAWIKECGGAKGFSVLKTDLGALIVSQMNGNS